MDNFLTTLYQNLFSARQALAEWRKGGNQPTLAFGSDLVVMGLLRDGKLTDPAIVGNIKKELKQLIDKGEKALVENNRINLLRLEANVDSHVRLIEEYMAETYERTQ